MPKHSPRQLDPRAPLVLDTRDLPRRPGALRELRRVVTAPADLGVELISVPEGADLDLDLRLQSVSEGVLVSGTVAGPVKGECGRCLREIDDSVVVTVQELYAYEDSTTDETTDEDEVGRMQGDLIDLEPALRDAVVLALPTNPLCREDCPGLCPECGVHWDDLPADHSHQQIDPRWAGLSQLNRTEE
ncbi:YceD family protein [Micromonospora sp. WMMD980]|uniref:YceD family protein n=1 Tax=Micromonospora sp. WMMD980 TaxID=3016088 RepID=UPI002416C161|nr:YceD family protein [Micromonospora sp. WMMD980]MDG4802413.1 YceD family protein [Micromonospora sp. WMMD980]